MKITVCGSMKFYQEMRLIKESITRLGHIPILPKGIEKEIPVEARDDMSIDEIVAAKIEYDFIREHFRKIQESDAILVLNYKKKEIEGYIGGNTFLEMGLAFYLQKKIYLLHDIPEMEYKTEMHAMQPIILHGNIKNIV
ncbi:MAG: hypothetical protein AAB966_00450 [Patescibacteria group bacterium]